MKKIQFVDLHAQYLSIKSEIDKAIALVIEQTAFIGGDYVKKFEQDFGAYLNTSNVLGCANGTDSIEILLKSFKIGAGDEVIVPAVSWISTSEAVGSVGAVPVFVDVDQDGLIRADLIEKSITSKTKCIIPVHLYGNSVDMTAVMKIAKSNNLLVLEDCAQAHGARHKNQIVGTIGDCSSFSFYPGKNLGAYGDAGRMISNHGQKTKHDHHFEGRNSRLDGLHAAVLSVKLKHLNAWTKKRVENASLYRDLLADLKQIKLPPVKLDDSHVYHLFVIQTESRDELATFLKTRGIDTAIHYPTPLPYLKAYNGTVDSKVSFPEAKRFTSEILSLPMYPELTKDEIEYIAGSVKMFFS
jgi:dTDP-4-amino-4,6-dideoxygalactose transaminase